MNISISLAGISSRTEFETESHFYSLALSDFITNSHKDLSFGFSDRFQRTRINVELLQATKNLTLAYEVDYSSYYKLPSLTILNHSINLKWNL